MAQTEIAGAVAPENVLDSRTTAEDDRRVLSRPGQPLLFTPLRIRSITLRNRIIVSPMCQYSAIDGLANQWHAVHLGARAVGGAGVVFTEAVSTEPRGRITKHCLGLWNDEQRDRLSEIAAFVAEQGAVPAIQIGHAGRKGSVGRPWEGSRPLSTAEGGWDVISPTARPYVPGWTDPILMGGAALAQTIDGFRESAKRARDAGFKLLELHAAHGYLFHQFYSPLSNDRTDAYGGSLENRVRFLFEAIDAVRAEWPDDLPLFVRISVTDWVEGGWTLDESITLARTLKAHGGVDVIDCSSGGNDPRQKIPVHPGYQVRFAETLRRESGIMTGAVGLIHSPDFAESILSNEHADVIFLGRTLLGDPIWPMRAARALRADGVPWPVQYERANIF